MEVRRPALGGIKPGRSTGAGTGGCVPPAPVVRTPAKYEVFLCWALDTGGNDGMVIERRYSPDLERQAGLPHPRGARAPAEAAICPTRRR